MAKIKNVSGKQKSAKKALIIVFAALISAIFLLYCIPLFAVLSGRRSRVVGEPQVMVIFGYKLDGDEVPPLLKSRLDVAKTYLDEHPDVVAILSGGAEGKTSEAQRMFEYLRERGVDENRLIKEERSATTAQNIRFSLDLIKEKNLDASKGILLVSNEFHLYRIKMLLRRADADIAASTLAAPSVPASDKAMMYLREPFALLYDFLFAKV